MEKIFKNTEQPLTVDSEKETLIKEKEEERNRLEREEKALKKELSLIGQEKEKINNMYDAIREDYFAKNLRRAIIRSEIKTIEDPEDEYHKKYVDNKTRQLENDEKIRLGLDKVEELKEEIKELSLEKPVDENMKQALEEDLAIALKNHENLVAQQRTTEENLEKWRKDNKEALSK